MVKKSKNYEYHKQNEYPGERVAEKKRVADREEDADKKADARVARKGRSEELKADARVADRDDLHEDLMDAETEIHEDRAKDVRRRRDSADVIGLLIIAGLVFLLVLGSVWGYYTIEEQSDHINTLNSELEAAQADNHQLVIMNRELCGISDASTPTILSISPLTTISPSNNEMDVVAQRVPITVTFSKDMNPLTINTDTFVVEQRTTPEAGSDPGEYRSLPVEGIVTYNNCEATFTSSERFHPNQVYGNVFTVTITEGVEDIEGNSLANEYIWSFTTGTDSFNTGSTTSQTN